MSTYTWQTPEYGYDFSPTDNGLVRVQSEDKQAIEDFLSTVELAGPEEGTEIPETIIEEGTVREGFTSYDYVYFVEVSRATVSLFLDFDVRYYMGTHAE